MPDPGQPGDPKPKNDDWLVRRIQDVERDVREFKQALGAQTGFTFVDGKIMSATFDGSLEHPAAAGTSGVGMGGPDDTIVVNNMVIRGQIIGDDALTNPVDGTAADGLVTGTLSGTALFTTKTITPPSGFTEALVIAVATGGMTATAAGNGYLQVAAFIDGTGPTISSWCINGLAVSTTSSYAAHLTGLSGSFTVQGAAATTGVCQAGAGNIRVSSIVTFLR